MYKIVKHNNNYKKQTTRIAIMHEKISNIGEDFLNKLSNDIIATTIFYNDSIIFYVNISKYYKQLSDN